MDRQLFEVVTGGKWLTDDELDDKRREMMGEGIDKLDEEWMDMLRFSYQMHQFDVLKSVEELGATTTIIILVFEADDIDEPDKTDHELLKSMQRQCGDVGKIARYIELDDSLSLDGAGRLNIREDCIGLYIWT
jgi:hypothetical protein